MAFVTPIGANPAQVDYRLLGGHGCEPGVSVSQVEYHTDEMERPLVWVGGGLSEVGIEAGAVFGEGDVERARSLVNGFDPRTGEQLVAPKLGVFEDSKVNTGALVRAVHAIADEADVSPGAVLKSKEAIAIFARLEKAYANRGDVASVRADEAGRVAAAAGLDPDVVWGQGVFERAYAGLFTTRQVTVTDENGERVVEEITPRREVVGNLGYDITFTLPKSYSLLLAFADDTEAGDIEGVYAGNVARVFDWLEESTAYGMRGKHGGGKTARTVATSGFLGWAMTHRAARPVDGAAHGDPHWHVHVTIANMARGEDGAWSTIAAGGRDLMRHAPAVDHALKALVRRELATRYGVEFARSERTGAWEIAGISDEAIREFSKRGHSIEAMLASLGLDAESATSAQAMLAKSKTREAKDGTSLSDEELRSSWRAQARAVGIDPEGVRAATLHHSPTTGAQAGTNNTTTGADDVETEAVGVVERARREGRGLTRDEQVEVITARFLDPENGLTSRRRRFSTVDAIAAAADALPDGAASLEELEELTQEALQASGIVKLPGQFQGARDTKANLAATHMSHADRYTTSDVITAEQTILTAAAAAAATTDRARVRPATVDMAIDVTQATQGFQLSGEQDEIVRALVSSGRAVEYVIGPPGTGKTTLMRAARAAWEADGYTVAGAATAAVAAANLSNESGIASRTVAQWVHAIRDTPGAVFAGVDVLVIDEANLTDDRDRATLYAEAKACGVKVVEVGDPKQLRGVGCGSSFGYAAAEYGAHELTVNRRQEAEDERAALTALREGRYVEGLQVWADKGHLVVTKDGDSAAVAMAAEWMRQRAGAPDPATEMQGLVMLAATNERVARLNEAAHAVRAAAGELGPEHTYRRRLGEDLTLSQGDYVMVRRNDRDERAHTGADVLNGTRALVTSIDHAGAVTISWETEDTDGPGTRTAVLPREFIANGGLDLGYAMTTHKAEGLTIGGSTGRWTRPDGTSQRGTVLVDPTGADNPGLYVALSRHKADVRLYAGLEGLETQQDLLRRGLPRDEHDRVLRGIEALAATMRATETNANDTPVHHDLGRTPAPKEAVSVAEPTPLDRINARIEQIRKNMNLTHDPRLDAMTPDEKLAHIKAALERKRARQQAAPEQAKPDQRVTNRHRPTAGQRGPRL